MAFLPSFIYCFTAAQLLYVVGRALGAKFDGEFAGPRSDLLRQRHHVLRSGQDAAIWLPRTLADCYLTY